MYQFFLLPLCLLVCIACDHPQNINISSPDNSIKATIFVDDSGRVMVEVFMGDQVILEPSLLGVQTVQATFRDQLTIAGMSDILPVSDDYTTAMEKRLHNTYKANEVVVTLSNPEKQKLDLTFRISNDGIAYRYSFNQENLSSDSLIVLKEFSSFNLPATAKAWLHPHANVKDGWCRTQPSYEETYHINIPVGTDAPYIAGWSFPALFQIGNNWALISESGLEPPYCGSRLSQKSPEGAYTITFPQAGETFDSTDAVTPAGKLPFHSPWRTIVVGSLSDIVESNVITALAAPAQNTNPDKFSPGISSWSWGILKDESVNYKTQKAFIDHASEMGWKYCLIDVNWDVQIGYEKMTELINYAESKNVGILLWYNSSGNWNTTTYTPKDKLINRASRIAEFERISKMKVKGVKVDFWPGDGPSAIQYYYDVLTDAAQYGLLVNCHGATVSRGWSRTFPNLASMEAVQGFEFTTFEQRNNDVNPVHCTILPFTRNAVGPMDYTPVCLGEIPGIIRQTSNAFELALGVVFQSGIQHIVETPESMKRQPDYVVDFLKSLPDSWDDIKLIDGYPGEYVVLARKDDKQWFIAGISALSLPKEVTLDLSSFNPPDSIEILTDGKDNRSVDKIIIPLDDQHLRLKITPRGGFVAVIKE
jgi:hypothetical protein